jgi:hypothetical protein
MELKKGKHASDDFKFFIRIERPAGRKKSAGFFRFTTEGAGGTGTSTLERRGAYRRRTPGIAPPWARQGKKVKHGDVGPAFCG